MVSCNYSRTNCYVIRRVRKKSLDTLKDPGSSWVKAVSTLSHWVHPVLIPTSCIYLSNIVFFLCVFQNTRCWTGVERLCLRCECWSWSESWPRGERNAVGAWKRLNWSILSRRWPPSTAQLRPGHTLRNSESLLVQLHAENMQCRSRRSSSCSSELRTQECVRDLCGDLMVLFRCRA